MESEFRKQRENLSEGFYFLPNVEDITITKVHVKDTMKRRWVRKECGTLFSPPSSRIYVAGYHKDPILSIVHYKSVSPTAGTIYFSIGPPSRWPCTVPRVHWDGSPTPFSLGLPLAFCPVLWAALRIPVLFSPSWGRLETGSIPCAEPGENMFMYSGAQWGLCKGLPKKTQLLSS